MGVTYINPYRFAGFSPLNLPNLSMWFDASDASTFTYSSGTDVSQWNDKSPNGFHLSQSTAARQPSRNVTISGIDAVEFSSDLLTRSTTPVLGRTVTVCVVMLWPSQFNSFATFWQSTASLGVGLFRNGSTTMWVTSGNGANWDGALSSSAVTKSVITVVSGATGLVRQNGSQIATGANGTTGTSTGWRLGADRNDGATTRAAFTLGEMIVCNSQLSGSDITDVETYLNAKWAVY